MKTKKFTTQYMVQLALMIAIILLMSFTPLGYLKVGPLSMTLLTVPVAVGAIVLGPVGGLICGLTFGLTSFYSAMTSGGFATMLLQISVFGTFVTCVVARVLDGWLTGLIFEALHKNKKTQKVSYYIAALCCPLLNTLFFMSSIVLFFYNSDLIQGYVKSLHVGNPFAFVVAFVGIQGTIEAIVCFVIASVVARVVYGFVKRSSTEPVQA